MQSKEEAVYQTIKTHFSCDIRHTKFVACLIVSLLKLSTCSLSGWSKAICIEVLLSSKYKRLQRFLSQFRFSQRIYVGLIWSVYGKSKQVVLTLDRTEYKQRGQWVQILMLGIAYKGMSIPLLWHTANRKGNCSQLASRSLLSSFQKWIQLDKGQKIYLTADREFIGMPIRQTFVKTAFHVVIRVRANALLSKIKPEKALSKVTVKSYRVEQIFTKNRWVLLRKPRWIYGQSMYVAGIKLPNGEHVILMSSEYLPTIAQIYSQRWQIETLFGAFKSRGFNLESCRVNNHKRISTLLFVVSITLIWAIRSGEWLISNGKAIPIKKFNSATQPLVSIFRHGLDYLRNLALNINHFEYLEYLLSCT